MVSKDLLTSDFGPPGASWGVFLDLLAALGAPGRIWAARGPFWGALGAPFGVLLAPLELPQAALGRLRGPLGVLLGPSWRLLGRSGRLLGRSGRPQSCVLPKSRKSSTVQRFCWFLQPPGASPRPPDQLSGPLGGPWKALGRLLSRPKWSSVAFGRLLGCPKWSWLRSGFGTQRNSAQLSRKPSPPKAQNYRQGNCK